MSPVTLASAVFDGFDSRLCKDIFMHSVWFP